MRLSLRNQKENIFYLILWLVLFAAPVLTSYIRSTTGKEIPVHWPEIFHAWKIFAVFLIIFLVHNFVLAPLLVYKERKRLYLATTGCLVAVFVLFNCYSSHRKEGGRPDLGPRMEVNDKMPPPIAEEPNLQGDNERPPFQKPRGPKPDEMPPGPPLLLTQGGIVNSLFLILLLGMNIGVKLYFKSDRDRKQMLVLERENIESQLEYLKYQINPHFFMNTLNNIHALVDIDPEKAKTSIVDLSKLMRYVLYEGNHPMVPLGRDVDFLRNYLKLMQLRYTDHVSISVSIPDELPDSLIAPMLLITFVENAFKHGVSYQQQSFVSIKLQAEDQRLLFSCRNSKKQADQTSAQQASKRISEGGVGLANVKKRLDLLYGRNYTLDIKDEAETYNVELNIPLT
jgi:hypothetical protein